MSLVSTNSMVINCQTDHFQNALMGKFRNINHSNAENILFTLILLKAHHASVLSISRNNDRPKRRHSSGPIRLIGDTVQQPRSLRHAPNSYDGLWRRREGETSKHSSIPSNSICASGHNSQPLSLCFVLLLLFCCSPYHFDILLRGIFCL